MRNKSRINLDGLFCGNFWEELNQNKKIQFRWWHIVLITVGTAQKQTGKKEDF